MRVNSLGRMGKITRIVLSILVAVTIVFSDGSLSYAQEPAQPDEQPCVSYGTEQYPTLEAALKEVDAEDDTEDVLTLLTDVQLEHPLVISKAVTIDLNGYTISGAPLKTDPVFDDPKMPAALLIAKDCRVTLKNGSIRCGLPQTDAAPGEAATAAMPALGIVQTDEMASAETMEADKQPGFAAADGWTSEEDWKTASEIVIKESVQPEEAEDPAAGSPDTDMPEEPEAASPDVAAEAAEPEEPATDIASEQTDEPEAPAEEPVTHTVKVTAIHGCPLKVPALYSYSLADKTTVEDGGSVTITNTPGKCYAIDSVTVNGTRYPAEPTVVIDNVTEDLDITVRYKKTGMFVLIDPGHGTDSEDNVGLYGYHEAVQMYYLSMFLVQDLNAKDNVYAGITKPADFSNSSSIAAAIRSTPSVTSRGNMAKGYDLFIAMHSNWADSTSPDRVEAIVSSREDLYRLAAPAARALCITVTNTMGCQNAFQERYVYTRQQSNGLDYFGVIRASAALNVPAMILEHSFHSNPAMTKWLLSEANLKKLAQAEANTIAGMPATITTSAPAAPASVTASGAGPTISWSASSGADGYQVFRSTSQSGSYTQANATTGRNWTVADQMPGTTYYYKVRAYRRTINGQYVYSAFTAPVKGTAQLAVPTVSVDGYDSYINIKYTPCTHATAYQIYRSTSSGSGYKLLAVRSSSCTSYAYADKSAAEGVVYYYKVRAVCQNNDSTVYSGFSAPASGTTRRSAATLVMGGNRLTFNSPVYIASRLPAKARPYQLKLTAYSNKMLLEWTDCAKLGADIDGYIVLRKVGPNGQYRELTRTARTRNYYYDSGANKKDTNYYYLVVGYKKDAAGRLTISSDSMSVVGVTVGSRRTNPYAPAINRKTASVKVGSTVSLRLSYPSGSLSTWTRWRSDDPSIATVNSNGVVTGRKKGTVLISGRTPNGRDIRCLVTVL